MSFFIPRNSASMVIDVASSRMSIFGATSPVYRFKQRRQAHEAILEAVEHVIHLVAHGAEDVARAGGTAVSEKLAISVVAIWR